jgi:hypothetical protein
MLSEHQQSMHIAITSQQKGRQKQQSVLPNRSDRIRVQPLCTDVRAAGGEKRDYPTGFPMKFASNFSVAVTQSTEHADSVLAAVTFWWYNVLITG